MSFTEGYADGWGSYSWSTVAGHSGYAAPPPVTGCDQVGDQAPRVKAGPQTDDVTGRQYDQTIDSHFALYNDRAAPYQFKICELDGMNEGDLYGLLEEPAATHQDRISKVYAVLRKGTIGRS
jgi:hypothetical protein